MDVQAARERRRPVFAKYGLEHLIAYIGPRMVVDINTVAAIDSGRDDNPFSGSIAMMQHLERAGITLYHRQLRIYLGIGAELYAEVDLRYTVPLATRDGVAYFARMYDQIGFNAERAIRTYKNGRVIYPQRGYNESYGGVPSLENDSYHVPNICHGTYETDVIRALRHGRIDEALGQLLVSTLEGHTSRTRGDSATARLNTKTTDRFRPFWADAR